MSPHLHLPPPGESTRNSSSRSDSAIKSIRLFLDLNEPLAPHSPCPSWSQGSAYLSTSLHTHALAQTHTRAHIYIYMHSYTEKEGEEKRGRRKERERERVWKRETYGRRKEELTGFNIGKLLACNSFETVIA